MTRLLLSVLAVVVCASWSLVAPSGAEAQWTLPRYHFGVRLSAGYSGANKEWYGVGDEPSGPRVFPLGGRYERFDLTLGVRWGITERFELGAKITGALATYQASPVILEGVPDSVVGNQNRLDAYQASVFDFSGRAGGLGDLELSGMFNILRGRFALAARLTLKLPGGYRQPEGTFRGGALTAEEFELRRSEVVTADNTFGNVTLGAGQVDIVASMPLGYVARTRTFVIFEPGYALRFGGAGDQFRFRLTIGQSIGAVFSVVGFASANLTVQDGDVYGVSVGANPPDTAPADFDEVNPLFLREVRLQRDAVSLGASAILRFGKTEVSVAYEQAVWGRNTAVTRQVLLSFATLFDASSLLAPDPEEEEELEVEAMDEEQDLDPLDALDALEQEPSPDGQPASESGATAIELDDAN